MYSSTPRKTERYLNSAGAIYVVFVFVELAGVSRGKCLAFLLLLTA